MTQTQERTLATRDFSDQQIQTRIKAASQPGFGLEGATRAQLNMIYLLAKHYDVDPAVDITLFRARPWFTIDGRIRLMKRHPQYRGYKCRPLPQQEKEAWGYKPDDLVVECTIRTGDWGEISARGKVSGAEMRQNAPTGSHPSEMAEKRAIARASRMAFGQDVPDEDETGYLVEERNNGERIAANAKRYDEIYGSLDDELPSPQPEPPEGPAASAEPTTPPPRPELVSGRSVLGQKLATLIEEAARLEVEYDDCKLGMPAPKELLVRAIERLEDRIDAKKRVLAGERQDEPQDALMELAEPEVRHLVLRLERGLPSSRVQGLLYNALDLPGVVAVFEFDDLTGLTTEQLMAMAMPPRKRNRV